MYMEGSKQPGAAPSLRTPFWGSVGQVSNRKIILPRQYGTVLPLTKCGLVSVAVISSRPLRSNSNKARIWFFAEKWIEQEWEGRSWSKHVLIILSHIRSDQISSYIWFSITWLDCRWCFVAYNGTLGFWHASTDHPHAQNTRILRSGGHADPLALVFWCFSW